MRTLAEKVFCHDQTNLVFENLGVFLVVTSTRRLSTWYTISWAIKSSFNHAYMSNYMSNKTTIFTLYSWHACNMGQNRCIDHDWRCTHLKGLSLTKCLQLKMREDKLVSLVLIGIITGANTCTSVISCRYNLSWMNYCIR